jgi:hypothetical protein
MAPANVFGSRSMTSGAGGRRSPSEIYRGRVAGDSGSLGSRWLSPGLFSGSPRRLRFNGLPMAY